MKLSGVFLSTKFLTDTILMEHIAVLPLCQRELDVEGVPYWKVAWKCIFMI